MRRKSAHRIIFFLFYLLFAFIFIGCDSDYGGPAVIPGAGYNAGQCARAIQAARESDCEEAWSTWIDCEGPYPCMCPAFISNCSSLYDDLFQECGCGLQATYAYAKQEGDKLVTDAIELIMPASLAVGI
jgi:hypothetical protein